MNKNNIDNFNEEFLIKKAAISLAEKDNELFDLLEKDNTITNPAQDELDRKIYSMINEKLGSKKSKSIEQKRLRKLMIRVAILVIILSAGFVIPFITVDAFREKVLNFYIENFDTHASFKPKEENPFMDFKVGYIPEGYVESDEFKSQNLYAITFYNQDNRMIDITLFDDEASFNVDTENCEEYNVTINKKNGYIYRKPDSIILIFKFHENSIAIGSNDNNLDNDELKKIAESIK